MVSVCAASTPANCTISGVAAIASRPVARVRNRRGNRRAEAIICTVNISCRASCSSGTMKRAEKGMRQAAASRASIWRASQVKSGQKATVGFCLGRGVEGADADIGSRAAVLTAGGVGLFAIDVGAGEGDLVEAEVDGGVARVYSAVLVDDPGHGFPFLRGACFV